MGLHDAAATVNAAVKDVLTLVIGVLGGVLGLLAFVAGSGALSLLSGTAPTFSAIGFIAGSLAAFVIFVVTALTTQFVTAIE